MAVMYELLIAIVSDKLECFLCINFFELLFLANEYRYYRRENYNLSKDRQRVIYYEYWYQAIYCQCRKRAIVMGIVFVLC